MCVYMYLHPSWVCVSVKSGSNRNAMLSTLTNMERYIISLQNTSASVHNNYVCVCTYTTFIWSKKCLDHDLDRNLDCELDRVQKVYPFTWDIHCSIQSASHCCSLFSHCYLAIHLNLD